MRRSAVMAKNCFEEGFFSPGQAQLLDLGSGYIGVFTLSSFINVSTF